MVGQTGFVLSEKGVRYYAHHPKVIAAAGMGCPKCESMLRATNDYEKLKDSIV